MTIATSICRFLVFQSTRDELAAFKDRRFLIAGLIGTWVVGMGRYWDDPGAHLLQHLGVGSLVYIFVMALIIWLVVKPYGNTDWHYLHVLTFVSLTSFPAVFYAIPVERYFDIDTSASMNAWFLAVVAAWRLALLFFFLRRYAKLSYFATVTTALLPVCLIIVALAILNLERAVFNIMGGIREKTSKDTAYKILVLLTIISFYGAIPLLIAYVVAIIKKAKSLTKTDKSPANS